MYENAVKRLLPDLHEAEDKLQNNRRVLLWQALKNAARDHPEVAAKLQLFGQMQGKAHVLQVWEVYECDTYLLNVVMGCNGDGPTYLLRDIPIYGERLPEYYVRLFMQELIYIAGMCLTHGLHDAINFETILVNNHMLFLYIDCSSNNVKSPEYLPIEVLRGNESTIEARLVWACGLFFYKLVYNRTVYEALTTFWWSKNETLNKVIEGELKPWFPSCRYIDKMCIMLLSRMLDTNPYKRATFKEILENEWSMIEV